MTTELEFEKTPDEWQDTLDEIQESGRFWFFKPEEDPWKTAIGLTGAKVNLHIVPKKTLEMDDNEFMDIIETLPITVIRAVRMSTKNLSTEQQLLGYDPSGKEVKIDTALAICFECKKFRVEDEEAKELTFDEMVELEMPVTMIWFNSLSALMVQQFFKGENPHVYWGSISLRDQNEIMEKNAGKAFKDPFGKEVITHPIPPDPTEAGPTIGPGIELPFEDPVLEAASEIPREYAYTESETEVFFQNTREDLKAVITGAKEGQRTFEKWKKMSLKDRNLIMNGFKFLDISEYQNRYTDCTLSEISFWPCDHSKRNMCPRECSHFTDYKAEKIDTSEEKHASMELAKKVVEDSEPPKEDDSGTDLTEEEKKVLGDTHGVDPTERMKTRCGRPWTTDDSLSGDDSEITCPGCIKAIKTEKQQKSKNKPLSKMARAELEDYAKEHSIALLKPDLLTNKTIRAKIKAANKARKRK